MVKRRRRPRGAALGGVECYRTLVRGSSSHRHLAGADRPPRIVVRYDDDHLIWSRGRQGTATSRRARDRPRVQVRPAMPSPRAAPRLRPQAMGITALGASVIGHAHFRSSDSTCEPRLTSRVVDMSGDVVRNVMLLCAPSCRAHHDTFPRPRPRPRGELRRARAPLRAAALELGGLRPRDDLGRRRRLPALGQVDRAVGGGATRARDRGGSARPERADPRHPDRPGRSPLERRHRHLREGTTSLTSTSATGDVPPGGGREVRARGR